MELKKIAFIGCGKISYFHADVLVHLGCKIIAVAARPNSKNISLFREKYKIPKAYDSYTKMLENEDIDAIWLTVSIEAIDEILLPILDYNIPVFIEKPVALSSNRIKEIIYLCNTKNHKIQIGYNRRFYEYVPAVKKMISDNLLRSIVVEIPESIPPNRIDISKTLWVHNSSHVLDLLYHLVGEYEIINLIKQKTNGSNFFNTFNGILKTNENIPVQLIANWNSPSNFGITFYFDNNILKLKPLEIGKLYQGFEIIEPTKAKPIRQYQPKIINDLFCSTPLDKFKPGFLKQAQYFFNLLPEKEMKEYVPCELKDALFVTKICEEIMK